MSSSLNGPSPCKTKVEGKVLGSRLTGCMWKKRNRIPDGSVMDVMKFFLGLFFNGVSLINWHGIMGG